MSDFDMIKLYVERNQARCGPLTHSECVFLIERISELEGALEPFANEAKRWEEMGDTRPIRKDTELLVSDLRNAAKATEGE